MLAGQTNPFSQPREHHSAVLFADLVAFTTWSEKRRPTQTIEVLREVHGLLAKIIFKHDGTLDKFIGDGLMATFGTPEPTKEDAFNALSAMIEMADVFETWRLAQFKTNDDTLKLAIGLHYGPVVIGDIGSDQRLEFAVLGDTVNVASRLEAATREVGCRCLVSGDLVEAAKVESPSEVYRHLDRLRSHNPISLRGRSAKLPVFVLP